MDYENKLVQNLTKKWNVRDNEPYTHTSLIPPKIKFNLRGESDHKKFLILYSNYICVSKNSPKPMPIGLTEVPDKYTPLRIDFDFKYSYSDHGLKRLYTKQHLLQIVKGYQRILSDVIHSSVYDHKMKYCIVLEKSKPRLSNNDEVKDGFHLHFPHCILSDNTQDEYIRNKIIEKILKEECFKDFIHDVVQKMISPKNDIESKLSNVIDKIATKTWLMYGSAKDEKSEPYKVSYCLDHTYQEISLDIVFEKELYSIKNIQGGKSGTEYYLPWLLTIKGHEKTIIDKSFEKDESKMIIQKQARTRNKIKLTRPIEESLEDLKIIEDGQLMDMLDESRTNNYNEWIDIGWILFNIGQGCEKALDMWIDFSRRSTKFQEGVCEQAWDKMEIRGKTIASLYMYAKKDSPEEYREWRNTLVNYSLQKCLKDTKPTHYSIAMVVYNLYGNKFVCANSKNNIWYEFYNHRWHKLEDGLNIMKLLPTEIYNKFLNLNFSLSKDLKNIDEDDEADKNIKAKRQRINKILYELQNVPFMKKVVEAAKTLYYDPKFIEKLDENRNIICFENGVYDLSTGIFKDGSPDDYCSLSTGNHYRNYSTLDPDVEELNNYLKKVFVNPRIRDYFLDFVCSCMQGGNRNKIFSVFTGEGDAGKSVIVKLLNKVFGEYTHTFPRETFVVGSRPTAGSARPDLAHIKGKRIAFFKEVAKNEKLHIGMIKEMTGNDSFYARGLYEKGGEINPMFTLILMCNEPPQIPAHDEPTWNRVKVLPFESCFPKQDDTRYEIPDTLEEQYKKKIFPRDPHLDEKIDKYIEPLTWVLLQRFKIYIKNGIFEPDEVSSSTYKYKHNNDVYLQFIAEQIIKTNDEEDYITLTETYQLFQSWHKQNYPSYKDEKCGQAAFKQEMNKRLNQQISKTKWTSFKFSNDLENKDEDLPKHNKSPFD